MEGRSRDKVHGRQTLCDPTDVFWTEGTTKRPASRERRESMKCYLFLSLSLWVEKRDRFDVGERGKERSDKDGEKNTAGES